MSAPTGADFVAYAAFVNGRCPACDRILPHPNSDVDHVCPGTATRDSGALPGSRPVRFRSQVKDSST